MRTIVRRKIHFSAVLVVTALLQVLQVHAQSFLNGSFESNTAGTDKINLTNASFNAIMSNTNAFGTYGDMDIITSSTWGAPQSGSWYVGLTGGSTDIITMKLLAPLVSGATYTVLFWDRGNSGFPTHPVQLGLSTSNSSVGSVIYTGPTPAIGTWTQRTATFVAPNNGQYISVLMPLGALGDWVNVDNFSFAIALPVQLASFSGINDAGVNHLHWVTTAEFNNDFFTVEKSSDGINFKQLGIVKGAGNSTQLQSYGFDDSVLLGGINYYRIKQTDIDGGVSYSSMITLKSNNSQNEFVVYPNPARDVLNCEIFLETDIEVTIQVVDISGRIQIDQHKFMEKGSTVTGIEIKTLQQGIYFLVVSGAGTRFEERFIKEQ